MNDSKFPFGPNFPYDVECPGGGTSNVLNDFFLETFSPPLDWTETGQFNIYELNVNSILPDADKKKYLKVVLDLVSSNDTSGLTVPINTIAWGFNTNSNILGTYGTVSPGSIQSSLNMPILCLRLSLEIVKNGGQYDLVTMKIQQNWTSTTVSSLNRAIQSTGDKELYLIVRKSAAGNYEPPAGFKNISASVFIQYIN